MCIRDRLEREKVALKGKADMQPDFSGKEYLLERQLKPEARRDIIEKLAEEGQGLWHPVPMATEHVLLPDCMPSP